MSATLEEVVDAAVARSLERHLGAVREALARLEASIPPRMLTVSQAAEALGCHRNTVQRMLAAGQLVYKRVGAGSGRVRIDARSLHGAGGGELGERRAAGRR